MWESSEVRTGVRTASYERHPKTRIRPEGEGGTDTPKLGSSDDFHRVEQGNVCNDADVRSATEPLSSPLYRPYLNDEIGAFSFFGALAHSQNIMSFDKHHDVLAHT